MDPESFESDDLVDVPGFSVKERTLQGRVCLLLYLVTEAHVRDWCRREKM